MCPSFPLSLFPITSSRNTPPSPYGYPFTEIENTLSFYHSPTLPSLRTWTTLNMPFTWLWGKGRRSASKFLYFCPHYHLFFPSNQICLPIYYAKSWHMMLARQANKLATVQNTALFPGIMSAFIMQCCSWW